MGHFRTNVSVIRRDKICSICLGVKKTVYQHTGRFVLNINAWWITSQKFELFVTWADLFAWANVQVDEIQRKIICLQFVIRKSVVIVDLQIGCFHLKLSWWRHQMETFSASLTICAGNSPVTGHPAALMVLFQGNYCSPVGEFPSQRAMLHSWKKTVDKKQMTGDLRRHAAHF